MQNKASYILRMTVIVATIAVLIIHPLGPVKATSSTSVYVLGVTNPLDPLILDLQGLTSSVTILPSVTSLTTLSPNSILYIDGAWLSTVSSLDPTIVPAIVQTMLTGLPTVEVRGDPSLLANSVPGLMKYQNPGLPLIAEGVQVSGVLASGLKQGAILRVISGFDYSVSAEFQWATQLLSQSSTPPAFAPMAITQALPSQFWQLTLKATTDTGDNFAPYGHVTTTFLVYALENSGSTYTKWFDIFTNQTVTPGAAAYHSSYRNYQEITTAQPNNYTNIFEYNGPQSQISNGPTTVTYNIGTVAGQNNDTVTLPQTMSYDLKSANVTNTSGGSSVCWIHTINGGTSAGKLTLQFIPGWTDEVSQTSQMNMNGDLQVSFATFSNSVTPTTTHTSDLPFQIVGG